MFKIIFSLVIVGVTVVSAGNIGLATYGGLTGGGAGFGSRVSTNYGILTANRGVSIGPAFNVPAPVVTATPLVASVPVIPAAPVAAGYDIGEAAFAGGNGGANNAGTGNGLSGGIGYGSGLGSRYSG